MSLSFHGGNFDYEFTPSISSSSSSSSVKSFSPETAMEEVWQDINLASLEDNSSTNKLNSTHRPSVILQDFLASPSGKGQSPAPADGPLLNSSQSAAVLSLNSDSSHDFLYFPNQNQNQRQNSHFDCHSFPSYGGSGGGGGGLLSPFDVVLGSSSAIFKKRPQQNNHDNDSSGDRRHKRMIKNRESAARSRARKQAYAQELEMEVAQLREENAKLRKEQEKLLTDQVKFTKRKKLHRSSTAPF